YDDGSIRLHDTESGRELQRLRGGAVRTRLRWHPTLPRLAVACSTFWGVVDLETGKSLCNHPQSVYVSWIDWHPAGRLLAVTDDSSVSLWDTQTDRPALLLEGPPVQGVIARFSRAGNQLVSTDFSGMMRVWDVQTGRQFLARPMPGPYLNFRSDSAILGA